MKYKWRPTKEQKAEKQRATSKYDYQTAGGEFIPTEIQNQAVFELMNT